LASLRDLQYAFAGAASAGDSAAIAPLIVANGLEPAGRVAIYANNVRENFLDALEAAFPVTVRLAGREWFRQTGREYRRRHPSRCGNLHYVGERFAAFLDAELADGPYAYFADVARLEWAYQEVLVAAEPDVLDLAALAAVSPERHADLVLEASPAVRLVGSVWPLLAIWRANQPDADPEAQVSLDAGPSRVLVMRREQHVELRELSAGEFAFIDTMLRAASITEAAEAALAADPQFDLTATLPRLAQLGVLTGFRVRSSQAACRSTDS
jgi:hypothetical protein